MLEGKMVHINEWVEKVKKLCKEFRAYEIIVGKKRNRSSIKEDMMRLCEVVDKKMDIRYPQILLALMDAYEVTRDEEMLQKVLDVVSGNLERLEISADAVKLLAYCYYYVEEHECVEKAERMLEELKDKEGNTEKVADAERVLKELTASVL